jgi:hypothetical protein
VGVFWLLRWRSARFRGWRLSDRRTWREGVLSLKHGGCNEAKKYHPAQQSPHENYWLPGNENPHGRTSGDEGRLTIAVIILRKSPDFSRTSCSVSSLRSCKRAKNSYARKHRLSHPRKCLVQIVLHPGRSAFSEGSRNS